MAKRRGILCKLESKLVVHKEWKDYHFELNLANFQYFKLGECNKPKKQAVVCDIVNVEATPDLDQEKPFSFVVQFRDKSSWNLAASSENDRQEWMRALKPAVAWPSKTTSLKGIPRAQGPSDRELHRRNTQPTHHHQQYHSPSTERNVSYGSCHQRRYEANQTNSVTTDSISPPTCSYASRAYCSSQGHGGAMQPGMSTSDDGEHLYEDMDSMTMSSGIPMDEYVEMLGDRSRIAVECQNPHQSVRSTAVNYQNAHHSTAGDSSIPTDEYVEMLGDRSVRSTAGDYQNTHHSTAGNYQNAHHSTAGDYQNTHWTVGSTAAEYQNAGLG